MPRVLQEVAICPGPDREALRAHGQARAQGRVASDAFGALDRSRVMDSEATIGGMVGSERWPGPAHILLKIAHHVSEVELHSWHRL